MDLPPPPVEEDPDKVLWGWYDLETTGFSTTRDKVVEVGAILARLGLEYQELANPGFPMPEGALKAHHISDEMVKDAAPSRDVVLQFGSETYKQMKAAGKKAVYFAGHNIKPFDNPFLINAGIRETLPTFNPERGMDTLILSRLLFDPKRFVDQLPRGFKLPAGFHKLQSHVARLSIPMANAHRAVDDIRGNLQLYEIWTEGVDPKKLEAAMVLKNSEEEVAKLIFAEGRFSPLEHLRSLLPPEARVAPTAVKRPVISSNLPPRKRIKHTSNAIVGPGPLDNYVERTRVTPAIVPAAPVAPREVNASRREFVMPISQKRSAPTTTVETSWGPWLSKANL